LRDKIIPGRVRGKKDLKLHKKERKNFAPKGTVSPRTQKGTDYSKKKNPKENMGKRRKSYLGKTSEGY